jgi:hypothetical protein
MFPFRSLAWVIVSVFGASCGPSALERAQMKGDERVRQIQTQACQEYALANCLDPAPCSDGGAPSTRADASTAVCLALADAGTPSPSRYARCTAAAECSAPESCHEILPDAGGACLTRCATNADCPAAPLGTLAPATCAQDGWCFLACTPDLPCPPSLRCEMLNATVGYCR